MLANIRSSSKFMLLYQSQLEISFMTQFSGHSYAIIHVEMEIKKKIEKC